MGSKGRAVFSVLPAAFFQSSETVSTLLGVELSGFDLEYAEAAMDLDAALGLFGAHDTRAWGAFAFALDDDLEPGQRVRTVINDGVDFFSRLREQAGIAFERGEVDILRVSLGRGQTNEGKRREFCRAFMAGINCNSGASTAR